MQWQYDLSVSHNKIGHLLRAQKDLDGALESYRASLLIAKTLVARDRANGERQRDLSVSLQQIGDVQVDQKDFDGAFVSYRASLSIAEVLAAQSTTSAEWRYDLMELNWKIGVIYWQGIDIKNVGMARDHFGAALRMAENLDQTRHLSPSESWIIPTLNEIIAQLESGQSN